MKIDDDDGRCSVLGAVRWSVVGGGRWMLARVGGLDFPPKLLY
jgi:hypothetical protein